MSDSKDTYYILKDPVSTQMKVKGSRFIGYASPASDEQTALDYLHCIEKKHYNATHNCYAYHIGRGTYELARYSDAGEPAGTAGRPILTAINRNELSDIICIVTRYFGGTKLGTGGLHRAYGECAGQTLNAGQKIIRIVTCSVILSFDYNLTGKVMTVISRTGATVEDPVYDDYTTLKVKIRLSKVIQLRDELVQATAGKIEIKDV